MPGDEADAAEHGHENEESPRPQRAVGIENRAKSFALFRCVAAGALSAGDPFAACFGPEFSLIWQAYRGESPI